jgi:hypothetical protein
MQELQKRTAAAEAAAKAEAEARRKAEADAAAHHKAEEAARLDAEDAAQAKAAQERAKAEAAAKAKAEAEARSRAEAEAKAKAQAQADAAARASAEAQAKRRAAATQQAAAAAGAPAGLRALVAGKTIAFQRPVPGKPVTVHFSMEMHANGTFARKCYTVRPNGSTGDCVRADFEGIWDVANDQLCFGRGETRSCVVVAGTAGTYVFRKISGDNPWLDGDVTIR